MVATHEGMQIDSSDPHGAKVDLPIIRTLQSDANVTDMHEPQPPKHPAEIVPMPLGIYTSRLLRKY
jgi:hypothetical protein